MRNAIRQFREWGLVRAEQGRGTYVRAPRQRVRRRNVEPGTRRQLSAVGIEVDRIDDEIRARPPSPDEAELLDIDPGVSVLTVRKTSIDTTGRIVEVADVVMPGDRTELVYSHKLQRWTT